jgi:hypothetical protein
VVEDGVAHWRPLDLGQIVRDRILVNTGLSAGERVVILGQRSLEDGDELLVAREGKCCTDGRVVFPQAGGALAAAEEAAP